MGLNTIAELATRVATAHQDSREFAEQYPDLLKQSLSVVLYVDPDTGNDDNDGLSWTSAKATIRSAADEIPGGGSGTINLVKGKIYLLTADIPCGNKFIQINGIHDFDYTGTYATIKPVFNNSPTLVAGTRFHIGQNGFLYLRGCRLETLKYTAAEASLTHTDYATSLLNTNTAWGAFWLEHCQVILNNGPLMHQHSAGSYGCADLFMREIDVTRTPVGELTDSRRSAVLMGTHGNAPIPFRLYAYRVILNNIPTLKELFTQTLVAAKTNVV